jgi:hypothetical protein
VVKRTVTLVAVGAAFTVWLYAAESADVRVMPAGVLKTKPVSKRRPDPVLDIPRLHPWPKGAALVSNGRDVFAFKSPRPVRSQIAPAPVQPAPQAIAPASPRFLLSGIAEQAGPEGPVRTAIISAPGALFLVREGEMLSPLYRVARISDNAVDLVELATNADVRIHMQ